MNPPSATRVALCEPDALAPAAALLRGAGVVGLRGVFSPRRVQDALDRIAFCYPDYLNASVVPPDHVGAGPRRFICPLPIDREVDAAHFLFAPPIAAVAEALLGREWEVEAFGLIVAHPGAARQKAHRDGGLMYPETGLDRVMPPAALTLAIPLVPVNAESGRTAFHPGTHRFTEPAADEEPEPLPLNPGDAALWDFRILHAGEANRGPMPRPMLYATLCRSFWADQKNFVPGHNRKLTADRAAVDALPLDLRRRLVRADCGDGAPVLSAQDYRRLVLGKTGEAPATPTAA